jgi:hypothetical protein
MPCDKHGITLFDRNGTCLKSDFVLYTKWWKCSEETGRKNIKFQI